ncbi:MAG: hypothetical protein HY691_20365, partial [Chloroflexi bacterium]|nr:hypothetical protein [Chloroflexota bacterium]
LWPVDFVSGCGMLLRCAALRRVGLFDERYFMYYEDADLCRRLAAAGYRVVADGRARMWHAVARSTAHDPPWRRYLRDRSRALFQLGAVAPWQRAPMAALLALAWGRQAARDLQAGHGAAAWASARGLWAGVRDAWAGMLTSPPVPLLTGVGMAAKRPRVGGSPFPPPDGGAPEGRFSRSFALPAAPFREGEAPAEPSPSPSNAQSVPTCPCKPSPSRRTETGT